MCGIAGIVDLKGRRDIDKDALRRMTAALAHRGPDGEGYHVAPGIGFGHRRLAIIDPQGGAQPFHSADGRSVVVMNGEIYNYKSLAGRLASAGAPPRTASDTEAVVEGFNAEGADFIERLGGMFAFAFWRADEETLILARDRLGERPLYYAQTADGFLLFASEIGALAASWMIDRETSHEALRDYFLYGYTPEDKAIWRGVDKLRPGTIMIVRRGEAARLRRYWRPDFAAQEGAGFDRAAEDLAARIDEAVRSQMISDAPLGAFLSGGVDSSAVVASMATAQASPFACTIGFEDETFDERPFARAVATRYGVRQVEETARVDAGSMIDTIAAVYGEPFADTSALPTWLVSRAARRHVTVALSGDGGDEIFAGYRRYRLFQAEEQARAFAPLPLRRATFGAAGRLYPKLDWAPQPFRLKTTLQALGEERLSAYARAVAINLPDRVETMLSREFLDATRHYDPVSVVAEAAKGGAPDAVTLAQKIDLETWLPGRMLTKVDRAAMAHGLEVRPPLLDPALVTFAGTLPASFKLDSGVGKRILKKALEPRLDASILHRRKRGFDLPVARWLREGPLLDRLAESAAWRRSGVLNPSAVDQMATRHKAGASDFAQELWTVLMFDAFLRWNEAQPPRKASA